MLTGCSVDTVPVSDTQISYDGEAASDTSDNNSDNSSADSTLLSEDVCIVPQKSNTATDAAITADAALLIDDSRHKVLYAQNVYGTEYPASVSKIATALMAIMLIRMILLRSAIMHPILQSMVRGYVDSRREIRSP